jgi:DNA modification methylase
MYARIHDTIYFYSKSKNYLFNPQKEKSYMMYKYGFKKSDFQIDKETGLQYSMVYARDVLEIPSVGSATSERIGYPTQKPEALLERIIKCATNEGDIVLDPFVGGGTTVAVADRLDRKWIGIDQSVQAVKVTELRLGKQQGLFSAPFTVQLHKYDYDTHRYANAFEF